MTRKSNRSFHAAALMLTAACFLFLPLTLSGCSSGKIEHTMTVDIAYAADPQQSEGGQAVVVERRTVPQAEGPALYLQVLNLAIGQPDSQKLISVYPPGLRVRSVTYADGIVTVDMSEEYQNLRGASLTLADYCTVLTLSGLTGVEGVVITTEGQPVGERSAGVILRSDDAIYSNSALRMTEHTLLLYFPDDETEKLTGIEQKAMLADDDDTAYAVAEALLAGYEGEDKNVVRFAAEGTKLLSLQVSGGVCYIDLSAAFLDEPHFNKNGQSLSLYAFVNSLCTVDGIEKVQFLIGGEVTQSSIHPLFDAPIGPEDSLVD